MRPKWFFHPLLFLRNPDLLSTGLLFFNLSQVFLTCRSFGDTQLIAELHHRLSDEDNPSMVPSELWAGIAV